MLPLSVSWRRLAWVEEVAGLVLRDRLSALGARWPVSSIVPSDSSILYGGDGCYLLVTCFLDTPAQAVRFLQVPGPPRGGAAFSLPGPAPRLLSASFDGLRAVPGQNATLVGRPLILVTPSFP